MVRQVFQCNRLIAYLVGDTFLCCRPITRFQQFMWWLKGPLVKILWYIVIQKEVIQIHICIFVKISQRGSIHLYRELRIQKTTRYLMDSIEIQWTVGYLKYLKQRNFGLVKMMQGKCFFPCFVVRLINSYWLEEYAK